MRLRGVRRFRTAAVLVPLLGAALVTGLAAPTAAADPDGDRVVSTPVSFDVVTANRSGVPCATSPAERRVTVRGHLTGPADELRDGVSGALYVHGNGYGEFFWRYGSVEGGDDSYDVVGKLARQGHVSVTVDRLGYGATDKPDGNDVCFGTEADVMHQIIGRLRSGDYQGDRTPRFDRIALLGHSAGGLIVEQEAAGFSDVDALAVLSSGELNSGPVVLQRAAEFNVRCADEMSLLGMRLPGNGSADGYAPLEANEAQFRADHFHNMDAGIADQLAARRTDDACGGLRNAPTAIGADPARNATIGVPVLFLIGQDDAFFSGDARAQAATFRSSPKVTTVELADTGHAVAFGRTAPLWRAELHRWLAANRF
jgi:pimeloyl-ACP methyl ester carboxylesterase